jgi:hypothetical protein
MVNWQTFVDTLKNQPVGHHRLRPPGSAERVIEVVSELGEMPQDLVSILGHFNGAELFIRAIPLVTLFGLSSAETPARNDWFVDRFTRNWREKLQRPTDWIIGVTNYGGVLALVDDAHLREWDSSQQSWTTSPINLESWLVTLLDQGAEYMNA